MTLIRFRLQEPEVDLSKTYDAVVVGSGAAGGMAAHVLTSQGMKVLLLEAGKTNIWARLALRLSDYDFKGKTHDGYGEDWPISYADIEPYYDRVDLLLGISGHKENLPHLPDS